MKSERNHECVGFISRIQDQFNIQKSIIVIQKFQKKNYDYVNRNKTSWQNAMFVPKFFKKPQKSRNRGELLQLEWLGIDLDYCGVEWFALKTN